MATVPGGPTTVNRTSLGFGAAAVCLGFIGLGFVFLAPFGVLLSVPGLICGIIGWVLARPGHKSDFWWSLWGTLLSLLAVAANLGILNYGTFENWWLGR
ncbi:MAG TPA: hypothetical protein VE999_06375 [Gemmataceae bacterium]|nr:hypothetical protein [Gemmataceae bacterium]